jgi:hypothetical protein
MNNHQEPYSFRIYVRIDSLSGQPIGMFSYWDSTAEGKALIDPWLYDHAAHNDLESKILLAQFVDGQTAVTRYDWAIWRDVESDRQVQTAIQNLSNGLEQEFRKFIEHCWAWANNHPNEPCRFVFKCRPDLELDGLYIQ